MQLINFTVIFSIVEECKENQNPLELFVNSERGSPSLSKASSKLYSLEETNPVKLSLV